MADERNPRPVSLNTGEVTLELLQGVRAGRREDLEALCRRIGPVVLTWVHLRTRPGMRGRLEPEEVVQEVWTRVLARIDSHLPEPTAFRAWIIGVARNVMFELSRQVGSRAREDRERWESFLGQQVDDATGVSVRIARADALRTFLGRVDEFGELERKLLVLHGLEGRGFPEIAEKVDMTRDAVAKRWQRLRSKLEAEGLPDYLLVQ